MLQEPFWCCFMYSFSEKVKGPTGLYSVLSHGHLSCYELNISGCSFQFETEAEGGKLRRNVLVEGNVGSVGAPTAIVSMLSGQEEMFAFRRAVSLFCFFGFYNGSWMICKKCLHIVLH